MTTPERAALAGAAQAVDLAQELVDCACASVRGRGGVDANQVIAYDVAHAAAAVGTARSTLLYGENGKPLYGVNPDAIYAGDDGYRALLEIEGGGAVQNNRLMKDVVETLLIPGAHHLALAVPHSIHGRSPYDFAINLISALYAREVPQRHVRGILVVGY